MELICIQNSDPFYRHLHKDGGERRRGRDDFREERAGRVSRCRKKKKKKELGIFFGLKNDAETVESISGSETDISGERGRLKVEWKDCT